MTDTIRIRFPEGGAWSAKGLGFDVDQADAASHRAGGAPHTLLLDLIAPVVDAEPGEEPATLDDGEWIRVGWHGDTLVYQAAR